MSNERPRAPVRRRRRACRLAPEVLFPVTAVPAWVGDLHQAVWGRGGRWVAVSVGALLSTPYLIWGGVTAVLLMVMSRLSGTSTAGR